MNEGQSDELMRRTRRIETRLVAFMAAMGVATPGAMPVFDTSTGVGRIILPSVSCTLKDILACVPSNWAGTVEVVIGSDPVTTLVVDAPKPRS